MANFFYPMTQQVSRKIHQCYCCAYAIEKGVVYCKQSGFWEGVSFTSHYHSECWDALSADGNFEFSPGGGEPPEGARTMKEARAAASLSSSSGRDSDAD